MNFLHFGNDCFCRLGFPTGGTKKNKKKTPQFPELRSSVEDLEGVSQFWQTHCASGTGLQI